MKSKISLFNESEFKSAPVNKAIFKQNIRECWGIWTGLLIVWLIFLPMMLYYRLAGYINYAEKTAPEYHKMLVYTMSNVLEGLNDVFVIIFAMSAIAVAMAVFSYLFKARNCNMMHTYPVSRLSLFATNYVSGLLFLIVPLMIGTAGSLLVGAGFGALDETSMKHYMIWMGSALLENVFFFSMAVCMLMFVGNIIAAPVLYLILNFLYIGCQVIWQGMISAVCYGLEGYMSLQNNMLTPIMYMRRRIGVRINAWEESYQYYFSGGKELAVYTAAAVVFVIIAVIVYKKKHVETAGDVITVGWMKPIFRWGVAICTSALGALFVSSIMYSNSFSTILVSAVIIGICAFFIAQMLLDRSVRVFHVKRIQECAVYIVLLCICYIGLDADILGLEAKVPAIAEVESASIYGGIELYTKDAQEIAWVQDIHRQIIDGKSEFERAADEAVIYTRIEYKLKNGSNLRRTYYVTPDDDARDSVAGRIHAYAKQPDVALRKYFGIHYPDITVYGALFCDQQVENWEPVRLSEEEAQQIYQAAIQDAKEGNLEDYGDSDGPAGTVEAVEMIGELTLEVRDEAGYESYSASYYDVAQKEATVEIPIQNVTCKNIKRVLKKLGYLS